MKGPYNLLPLKRSHEPSLCLWKLPFISLEGPAASHPLPALWVEGQSQIIPRKLPRGLWTTHHSTWVCAGFKRAEEVTLWSPRQGPRQSQLLPAFLDICLMGHQHPSKEPDSPVSLCWRCPPCRYLLAHPSWAAAQVNGSPWTCSPTELSVTVTLPVIYLQSQESPPSKNCSPVSFPKGSQSLEQEKMVVLPHLPALAWCVTQQ